jgi:TPP-dependent pyruvate/acetoin dehydrogenase alpha subunit
MTSTHAKAGVIPIDGISARERLYLQMMRIRRFEERVLDLFERRMFRGATHLYVGMEAIAVGVCEALREDDLITSTHRGHGHCIAKGLELPRMMAEILGRADGYCQGKGGSMHITAISKGMLGADAVVGGSLALAVGAAYGSTLRGHDRVAVAFFGDGASNQGAFHEASNLAAVLDAPVVFVCENNQWAISTPIEAAIRVEHIASRADSYGFPGVVVDGNDVELVYEATTRAVARARRGEGPTLIEAKTFRVGPHSAMPMPETRQLELLREWEARDPIDLLRRRLLEDSDVTEARIAEFDAMIDAELEKAVEFALASPVPEAETAIDDVYAPSTWTQRGRLS